MKSFVWSQLALSVAVLCMVSLTACSGSSDGDVDESENRRIMSPQAGHGDVDELVEGNTAFAFDMYQAISQGDNNLVYSPYSISQVLAMAYAGARGETEQQIRDTLYFTSDQHKLHPAFNALDLELASRGHGAEGTKAERFRLNIANAIWGQTGHSFLARFLNTLAENYGDGLRQLDLAGAPEQSRVAINDWVSDKTEGKIQDLLPPGSISDWTRLVLTSAIYFDAAWDSPFRRSATHKDVFYPLGGGIVLVDMMSQEGFFGYVDGPDYQVVELPYDGKELSLVIFVPDRGSFRAFESSLTADEVANILTVLSYTDVNLTMPKFTFWFSLNLNQILATMGMPDAFDAEAADFSGMDGTPAGQLLSLYISHTIHKAFIAVDEKGTEAAAATAGGPFIMTASVEPDEPVEVVVDRPFIFMIRDLETETVLFLGRVLNPEA